jgi:hypothetical protein
LLERWLSDVAAMKLRPRSLERYEGIVRRQLIPALGTVRLRALTPHHVAGAYADKHTEAAAIPTHRSHRREQSDGPSPSILTGLTECRLRH